MLMDWYSLYLCTCNQVITSASVGGGSAKAKQACLCIRLAPHLHLASRTKMQRSLILPRHKPHVSPDLLKH